MKNFNFRNIFSASAMGSIIVISANTLAQSDNFNPPDMKANDQIGVDLISGLPNFSQATVLIGPQSEPMAHSLHFDWAAMAWGDHTDNNYGVIYKSTQLPYCDTNVQCEEYIVRTQNGADRFWVKNGTFISVKGRGATLIQSGNIFTYTDNHGVVYQADDNIHFNAWCLGPASYACAAITQSTTPTGLITKYVYQSNASIRAQRLLMASRNDGLVQIYAYDPTASDYVGWQSPTSITAVNTAFDYCDINSGNCSLTRSWPTATITRSGTPFQIYTYVYPQFTVTDWQGRVSRYTNALQYSSPRIVGYKAPSSASADTASYQYYNWAQCSNSACNVVRADLLKQATVGTGVWTYHYSWYQPPTNNSNAQSPDNGHWATGSVNPDGLSAGASYNTVSNIISGVGNDAESVSFKEDVANNLIDTYRIAGKVFTYDYDGRGNAVKRHQQNSNNSNFELLDLQGFDASCANIITCNFPNYLIDANGKRTDFTYDANHGGLLTITAPPNDNGTRPQTRRTYAQRYAWVKTLGGSYVRAAQPLWKLMSESVCRNGAAGSSGGCSIAGDEVITTYDYGPDQGPNNLWKRGYVITSTDGGITTSVRTCFSYDALGNIISKTTSNANLASCT